VRRKLTALRLFLSAMRRKLTALRLFMAAVWRKVTALPCAVFALRPDGAMLLRAGLRTCAPRV
jgi:hypothetical protein